MWKIAIVFLLVSINFGYWYWTTTPFYSILEIRQSIVHHDLKTFEQYVDVERVSSKMIDGFLTPQVRSRLSKGVLGEMLGSSLIGLVKPTLMEVIKDEVSHFVENNQLNAAQLNVNQMAANQAAERVSKGRRRADNATAPAIGKVLKVTKTKEGKTIITEATPEEIRAASNAASAGRDSTTATATATTTTTTTATAETRAVFEEKTEKQDEQAESGQSFGGFGLSTFAMKNVTGKLGFGKKAFKKIAFIRVRQNDATIGVTIYNKRYDTNMLLELRMEKKDEHWRLVEVSNFASFVYQIIAHEQMRRDRAS